MEQEVTRGSKSASNAAFMTSQVGYQGKGCEMSCSMWESPECGDWRRISASR